MQSIHTTEISSWNPALEPEAQSEFVHAIESGKVIYLPNLSFEIQTSESAYLSPSWLNGSRKNISLDSGKVGGAKGSEEDLSRIATMVERFSQQSTSLVKALFPNYTAFLNKARTSFRPSPVEGKPASWRKDDSRLHVDAFPSRPTNGERILRIFSNVNPNGLPRVWRVGEPFEDAAKFLLPSLSRYNPFLARIQNALGITKSLRSEYDHMMLEMHDKMKADTYYQDNMPQQTVPFPSGCTWICYSDQVLHAAMGGQFMFEQTFNLPVEALKHPDLSPLRVLERLTLRNLTS